MIAVPVLAIERDNLAMFLQLDIRSGCQGPRLGILAQVLREVSNFHRRRIGQVSETAWLSSAS